MKIKEIRLKDHKRFTSLQIRNIPAKARLVVLMGPHGCGKSSLFDALYVQQCDASGNGFFGQSSYYRKSEYQADEHTEAKRLGGDRIRAREVGVSVDWHDFSNQSESASAIYVRTAYRNDPVLNINSIAAANPMIQEQRFSRMIENDAAVALNFQRLVSQALEKATATQSPDMSIGEYRRQLLGPLQESMSRLFFDPLLVLDNLGNPLEGRNFTFTKGISGGFPYMNLSAGEKSAFDLLLDIHVKSAVYSNTVYCIDEPEVHMGTRLQGDLLEEMLRILPGESQLWIATHSIGMMRRAFKMHREDPDIVAFLDFTGRDFDKPVVIEPSKPNRQLWTRIHGVALDDLAELTAPDQIVICEGDREGEFDAECYRVIFEEDYPSVEFVSTGSHSSVRGDALLSVISQIARGAKIIRVIDKDDRHDKEVDNFEKKGVKVLNRRCIEHYLLDGEVFQRFFTDLEGEERGKEIANILVEKMGGEAFRAKSSKEVKGAANHLCDQAKQLLTNSDKRNELGTGGNAFMRHALARYVRGTKAYEELREVIFGKPNNE